MAEHVRALGRRPAGFWLPECGYYPGLERVLADEGLRFTFLDAHGLADAEPTTLKVGLIRLGRVSTQRARIHSSYEKSNKH